MARVLPDINDLMIRKAKPVDAPSIKALMADLGYQMPLAELEVALGAFDRADEIFVAAVNTRIVAQVSLIYFDYFPLLEKTCRITSIVVEASVRGQRIGTHLIEFAKEEAHAHGCTQLEVTTSLTRESAQKFYESTGFEKLSFRYSLPLKA